MKPFHIITIKLSELFEKLGEFVATYPIWTITLSLLSSVGFSLGIMKIEMLTDFFYTFTPLNCRAYEEQRIVNQLFPMNSSYNFDLLREANRGRVIFIIITCNDNKTVLRKSAFTEITTLSKMANSVEVKWKNRTYTYTDICAKNNGECYYNPTLNYYNQISKIEANEINIKYPIEFDLRKMDFNITGFYFGGVKVNKTNTIVEAKAFRLVYFLDSSNEETNKISSKWEKEFRRIVSKHKSDIVVKSIFMYSDYELLNWEIVFQALKYGSIGIMVVNIFSVVCSLTMDWITSKPILAITGCISVGLAVLASTGITSAFGIPSTSINTAIAFMIMGIGVDDMFLLISTWRTTDSTNNVIKRMAITYSHAAMSITMTSFTNALAFAIGATILVPGIRVCCIYGAVAVTFDLIYQLTFFGACMALDGYREEKKLHPLTLKPVILAQEAGSRSRLYQIFFTNKSQATEDKPLKLVTWCYDKLGYWISKKKVSGSFIIILMVYIAGASWGCMSLENGLEIHNLFPYDSETYTSFSNLDRYFSKYNYPVQVIFNDTLDYSNRGIQKKVLRSVDRFYQSKYIQKIKFNWLNHFLFISKYNTTYSSSYNLSNPKAFINCLRNEFFHHPLGRMYRDDVRFHENGTHITASRFIIINNVNLDVSKHTKFIVEMRSIADSLPFTVTVQSFWWLIYELTREINKLTLQTVGTTVALVFLVVTFLSFDIRNAIVVTLTMLSIELGMFGYMSLLGITLNPITLIILVLSIGLSVDSSIHVCYAYGKSDGTYRERIQQTLFSVGIPVFQGCCSTIFGILPIAIIEFYIFRSIVILVCLLIIISFFHAIFILPVLLSFWTAVIQFFNQIRRKEMNMTYQSSPQMVSVIKAVNITNE